MTYQETTDRFDDSTESAPVSAPTSTPSNRGDKLRELADKMQPAIDNKLGDRLANTPKRQREAAYARQEGGRLKRTQEALNALAALHDAGNVPLDLVKVTTKKAVYELMRTRFDNSNCGYYDAPIDTGEPAIDTPAAKALWALVAGKSEEDKQAEELRRKIDALQFANIPGYFPTPPVIVAAMLDRADIQGGQTVLEPSAGAGAILDALVGLPDIVPGAYETQHSLREILEAKGHALLGRDFMEADESVKFDRIVMNPPFEKLQDIDHVLKAYNCLAPGGRLVSIMSPGPFFRDTAKARDFREWFEALGGEREDLPEGTFKESGTGVASCLVTIDKP